MCLLSLNLNMFSSDPDPTFSENRNVSDLSKNTNSDLTKTKDYNSDPKYSIPAESGSATLALMSQVLGLFREERFCNITF